MAIMALYHQPRSLPAIRHMNGHPSVPSIAAYANGGDRAQPGTKR